MASSDKTTLSDIKLYQLIQDGDQEAFKVLYNKYWKPLFNSAYKVLGEVEASKDAVQEVFLDALENPKENILNLEAYLHQSVKYNVLKQLRRGKVSQAHLDTLEIVIAENSTEDSLNLAELSESVERIVDDLPEKCRHIFRLSREENLSNKEIAEKLNLSVRTVETHISNALRQIRLSLDDTAAVTLVMLLFLQR